MRISRIYLQINNIKRIIWARAVINDITYTSTMPVIITNGQIMHLMVFLNLCIVQRGVEIFRS